MRERGDRRRERKTEATGIEKQRRVDRRKEEKEAPKSLTGGRLQRRGGRGCGSERERVLS